jgi:hypothetical protein
VREEKNSFVREEKNSFVTLFILKGVESKSNPFSRKSWKKYAIYWHGF